MATERVPRMNQNRHSRWDEHAIVVWPFAHAPREFKGLSPHGGDEDWLALLPASYLGNPPMWCDDMGGPFGCSSVSEHELPDGRVVRIGAHA